MHHSSAGVTTIGFRLLRLRRFFQEPLKVENQLVEVVEIAIGGTRWGGAGGIERC